MLVILIYWLGLSPVENAVLDPALYLSPSPPLKETSKDVPPAEFWSQMMIKRVDCTTHTPTEDSTKGDIEIIKKGETVKLLKTIHKVEKMEKSETIKKSSSIEKTETTVKKKVIKTPETNEKLETMEKLETTEKLETMEKLETTEKLETMEKSETFWPFVRSPDIRIGGVHIPLTFSVSGTYDKLHDGSGVIAATYLQTSGSSSSFGNYGKSALAGSGYGKYATGYPNVKVYAGNNQPAWGGWGNGKWGHYGKG